MPDIPANNDLGKLPVRLKGPPNEPHPVLNCCREQDFLEPIFWTASEVDGSQNVSADGSHHGSGLNSRKGHLPRLNNHRQNEWGRFWRGRWETHLPRLRRPSFLPGTMGNSSTEATTTFFFDGDDGKLIYRGYTTFFFDGDDVKLTCWKTTANMSEEAVFD